MGYGHSYRHSLPVHDPTFILGAFARLFFSIDDKMRRSTWYLVLPGVPGTTPTRNIQDKMTIYEYDIVKFIYRTVARRYAPEPIVHMCSC